ncbi:MAG TPA: FMN-binding protein [Ruminococcaceae bacterium]|nr:FMN-binding protein [Oscillospiraceae bacterium]
MYVNLYEHEETAKNKYDGIRQYCIAEKVPEDYLRGSIGRKSRLAPMKRKTKITLVIAGLIITAMLSMYLSMYTQMERDLESLEFYKTDLNVLEDGIYHGEAETALVKVVLEVEATNHKITGIDILKHDNGMGKKAERITEDMIRMNTYDVDAVSGATSSSQVIKSAVSNALAHGKREQ